MKTEAEHELLKAIFDEMQVLKKSIVKDRRVGRAEFAHLLNIEPETLDARIRFGKYNKPFKDGRKSYWLESYVQSVVVNTDDNEKAA